MKMRFDGEIGGEARRDSQRGRQGGCRDQGGGSRRGRRDRPCGNSRFRSLGHSRRESRGLPATGERNHARQYARHQTRASQHDQHQQAPEGSAAPPLGRRRPGRPPDKSRLRARGGRPGRDSHGLRQADPDGHWPAPEAGSLSRIQGPDPRLVIAGRERLGCPSGAGRPAGSGGTPAAPRVRWPTWGAPDPLHGHRHTAGPIRPWILIRSVWLGRSCRPAIALPGGAAYHPGLGRATGHRPVAAHSSGVGDWG